MKSASSLLHEYFLFETHLHSNDSSNCARASAWQWRDFFKLNFPWIKGLVLTNHSHSPGLYDSRIMTDSVLLSNYSAVSNPNVFSGLEVNILKNGDFDVNQLTLEKTDWVMAALNPLRIEYDESKFVNRNTREITNSFIRVINSEKIDVLGHPTANIKPQQLEEINWDSIFSQAKKNGVMIEVNLLEDIPNWWLKILVNSGCIVSLGSDWHGFYHFRRFVPKKLDDKEIKLWEKIKKEGRNGFDTLDTNEKERFNNLYLQKPLGQPLYDWHSTELIKAITFGLQKDHVINTKGFDFLSNYVKNPKLKRRKLITQL